MGGFSFVLQTFLTDLSNELKQLARTDNMHAARMFLLIPFVVLIQIILIAAVEMNKPGRRFGTRMETRRSDVTPREVVQLLSGNSHQPRISCAGHCYRRQWCLAYNVLQSERKCELFDSKANSALVKDNDCLYEEKISEDNRACEGLLVLNGTNISSGTKHEGVVNISCNTGFSSAHKNVSCHDGMFKAHPAVKNGSVASIICYKDCELELVVINGTNITIAFQHDKTVEIKCDDGLSTYYPKAVCNNGVSKPTRAICGDYPQIDDPKAMRWQGQFFKIIANPSLLWVGGIDVCANVHKNGIMVTALTPELLSGLVKIVGTSVANAVGLKQKTSQSGMNVGWQWINTGTNAVIDIDTSKTNKPVWRGISPDDHFVGENNEQNYAFLIPTGGELLLNDGSPLYHAAHKYVICQNDYPAYEFEVVNEGSRLAFPHESSLVGVSLQNCTQSCLNSAFCRAFSYSAVLSDCWHHSAPPSDPKSIAEIDQDYNIYA